MVSEEAKAVDMVEFLELVREENRDGFDGGEGERPIVMVLDNARVYAASSVKEKASVLCIVETFLPAYSLDLMPVEFGRWIGKES